MNRELMPEAEKLPGSLDSNFGSFNAADWWFTVALASMAVITWQSISVLVIIPVIVLWYLLMVRRNWARRYEMIGSLYPRSLWTVRVRKGNVRVQGDPSVENEAGLRRRKKAERTDTVIPFVSTSVPTDLEGGTIGVAHHKEVHTDSFVIVSEGSEIASLNLVGQHDAYTKLSDMARKLVGAQRGVSIGLSYVFGKDPFDSSKFEADLAEFLHPEVFVPSGANIPEGEELTDEQARWLLISENWSQLRLDVVPRYGRKVWMAVVITIRREGILAKASGSQTVSPKQIRKLPINKMAKIAIAGLKSAGVSNPRPLDKGEIHDFIRRWDVMTIGDYYEARQIDPEAAYQDGFNGHWPSHEMKVGNGFSLTDGTRSAVLKITGSREQVWQGYWRQLMGQIEAPYFSCALVGSAVSSSWEVWGLERVTALVEDFGDIIGVNRKTLKMEKREQKLNARKRDIFDSELSQSYSILCAPRAGSDDELEEYVSQIEGLADELGMSVELNKTASLQYPALWSAVTGIPML